MALHAQGLTEAAPFGHGRDGALRAIEHLGYVQLDTISVIERAHHHVFWTRVPGYTPDLLPDLLTHDPQVFEGWSHAASLLPLRDYRFHLPQMQAYASGEDEWYRLTPDLRETMAQVLARIAEEGPLLSRDFEAPEGKRSGPWFAWKPAKRALTQLLMSGLLMVRARVGFQRQYDLTERVLPAWVDTTLPSPDEWARHVVLRHLQAHGLATEQEIRYLRPEITKRVQAALTSLTQSGEIVPMRVAGIDKSLYYALPPSLTAASRATGAPATPVRFLSPFDNVVIRRKRLTELFAFDYQLECYVPEPKRQYGYFCLPILWGDRLVGRMDAKADRENRQLIVRLLAFEPDFTDASAIQPAFTEALSQFAAFNGCDHWVIGRVTPASLSRLAAL
jgi:uncharacterized protein YcaQ